MIQVIKNKEGTNIKELVCDKKADMADIDLRICGMGTTCFVIDEDMKYMLSGNQEWLEIPGVGTSSGSEGESINDFIFDKVKKVVLENCNDLKDYAFANKINLEEVIFPDASTRTETTPGEIGDNVFQATGIKKIRIPGCYKTINDEVFYNCKNLEEVVLEEGIENISGYQVFAGTDKLKEITLPESLISIGFSAMQNSHIEELRLPKNCIMAPGFPTMAYLKKFEFAPGSTIKIMPKFNHCTSLETIIGAENITELSSYCFSKCYKLKFTIPSGVKTIPAYAFGEGYDGGQSYKNPIYIPSTVTSIDANAFKNTHGIINCEFSQGAVSGAPWGFKGTINYDVPAPSSESES